VRESTDGETGDAVLRESDLDAELERLTGGLGLDAGPDQRVRRWGWTVAAAGVALQIAGVIAGAYGRDAGQSGAGGALSATHVGRVLLIGGLGVSALGAVLALAGPWLYGTAGRPSVRRRVLRVTAPIVSIALVGAGAGVVGSTVLHAGATATPVLAATGTATAVVDPSASTNPDVAAAVGLPDQPLDQATRDGLAAQLTAARQAALRYPTVADAKRAGMYLAGGFAPGSGAHYMWTQGVLTGIRPDGTVDPSRPASFIYDGTSPTSRIVGLMYISLAAAAPQGFAGPNDHWHRHFNTCVRFGNGLIDVPFPADADVTQAQCDAAHGQFMRQTVWMLHAWVVPGWESPQGVFSHANPDLRCADGTLDTDPQGFCKGT